MGQKACGESSRVEITCNEAKKGTARVGVLKCAETISPIIVGKRESRKKGGGSRELCATPFSLTKEPLAGRLISGIEGLAVGEWVAAGKIKGR